MTETVITQTRDNVFVMRLNRPEKKNALNSEMYAALADGLEYFSKDSDLGAIVILGHDDVFSAGNDIADFLNSPVTEENSPVIRFLKNIAACEKPVVAGVNGLAIGIGTTLLLHCDLVYAGHNAQFQLPFIHLGLVPEAASSYLLPRMAGYQKAAELLMLGEAFDADMAKSIGLANEVLPIDQVETRALERAKTLSLMPRNALMQTKALLKSNETNAEQRLKEEITLFAECLKSDEARTAFINFMARSKK